MFYNSKPSHKIGDIDAVLDAESAEDAADRKRNEFFGLVRAELAAERHDIEAIVRDVLASTSDGRTTTKIHVSPEDAARLNEVTFRAATEVVSDEAISTGSVRVQTPQGVLVRDIDECMRNIADRLTKEVTK